MTEETTIRDVSLLTRRRHPTTYSVSMNCKQSMVERKECVLAIPPFSLAETVVRIGDVSGKRVDKFSMFDITPLKAETVRAPLIKECLCNIECKVTNRFADEGIFCLQGAKAWVNPDILDRRLFHAFGDGIFVAEGEKINLARLRVDKLPFLRETR